MINPVVDYVEMMVLDSILFPVLSYLYLQCWHNWVNNDYAESFFAFVVINYMFT